MKVSVLIGFKNGYFYIYNAYCQHSSQSNFIDGMYALRDYVGGKTTMYNFIENNSLQNPIYEQIILPLIFEKAKRENIPVLEITPDDRDKGDKWTRIEANLEPKVRLGLMIFNETQKGNPHMTRLEKQFLNAKPTSKELGGPDATEGGVHIVQNKILVIDPKAIKVFKTPKNANRY